MTEKRSCQRAAIWKKIRFTVGTKSYTGLIGDISIEGMCIVSKYRFVRGSTIDLKIPPMCGTVQYCVPYKNDFFKTGLRLLKNNH